MIVYLYFLKLSYFCCCCSQSESIQWCRTWSSQSFVNSKQHTGPTCSHWTLLCSNDNYSVNAFLPPFLYYFLSSLPPSLPSSLSSHLLSFYAITTVAHLSMHCFGRVIFDSWHSLQRSNWVYFSSCSVTSVCDPINGWSWRKIHWLMWGHNNTSD